MERRQRVIIGFGGIILCVIVGALSVKGRFEPGQILATIAGIMFFVGAYRAVFSPKSIIGEEHDARVAGRAEIERRLTDIQEIVISIDERLKRLERATDPLPAPAAPADPSQV